MQLTEIQVLSAFEIVKAARVILELVHSYLPKQHHISHWAYSHPQQNNDTSGALPAYNLHEVDNISRKGLLVSPFVV